jgi:2'-deoxynucleoside 5'-phosphate N-hydrolase
MRIYLAIKFHSNNQNQPLIESISDHLSLQGHSVVCAVKDFEKWGTATFEPQELLFKAFEAIENSDMVLIEASEKGMGVGIEAGFAFARKKPVITIAQHGSDISINLRSLSSKVISYSDVKEIVL